MYSAHGRNIGGPPPPTNPRLGELLDQVRAEFDTEAQRTVEYENRSKSTDVLQLRFSAVLYA
jgi:hypothetical protein